MTLKEQLVELIRAEGYDFFTACEMADHAIASGPGTYYVGRPFARLSFTLR